MIARIRHYVLSTLWAVSQDCAAVMMEVIDRRHVGVYLSAAELQATLAAAAPPRDRTAANTGDIAVLPLWGLIAHRAHQVDQLSGPGGTSTERFAEAFRNAVRDPSIAAIVIDVNSPGGSVDGVPELAAEIRTARAKKPIIAYANSIAASAAYWLATAAGEVVVTPSGQVGSIGVFAAHEDRSAALAKEGTKITLVAAGKYKVDGNPFEPISDTARGDLQAKADAFYGMFVRDVAKNRRIGVDVVRSGFGEGRMVLAQDAVAQGMADRVETFQELVSRLMTRPLRPSAGASALDGADPRLAASVEYAREPSQAVGDRVRALVDHMPGMTNRIGSVTEGHAGDPPYYAVLFDGDRMPHRWLSEEEIAPIDETATPMPDDSAPAAVAEAGPTDEDYRRTQVAIAARRQGAA